MPDEIWATPDAKDKAIRLGTLGLETIVQALEPEHAGDAMPAKERRRWMRFCKLRLKTINLILEGPNDGTKDAGNSPGQRD